MKGICGIIVAIFLFCIAPVQAADSDAPVTVVFINPHAPQVVPEQANALTNDVNATRIREGLTPLRRDPNLDAFARAKAQEMAARGYFGHTSPTGVTFEDRLREWRWSGHFAAENIAFDWDEPHAHTAFLKSPPHRRNLMEPAARWIGVAAVAVGDEEIFYVEEFSG